ncbi:MAG: hypothetical protein O210_OD1C00001G0534 [Parcubacteria bacterium RAAC4_OD1_1]|nr:MAG: hypothetical protein O210_OD1C00001G0534 [Parcubacteria bacterium RAAC4_OD1_1]
MKKVFLISGFLFLIVSAILSNISSDVFIEKRVNNNLLMITKLEKEREIKINSLHQSSMSMMSAARIATSLDGIDKSLSVHRKRLEYWDDFDFGSPLSTRQSSFRAGAILSLIEGLGLLLTCIFGLWNEEPKKDDEKMIDKICHKENRILAIKEWLGILFFLTSIIVIITYFKVLSIPIQNYASSIDRDRAVAVIILVDLSIFASMIIIGFLYNKALSKKLNLLWEQKKRLFV